MPYALVKSKTARQATDSNKGDEDEVLNAVNNRSNSPVWREGVMNQPVYKMNRVDLFPIRHGFCVMITKGYTIEMYYFKMEYVAERFAKTLQKEIGK